MAWYFNSSCPVLAKSSSSRSDGRTEPSPRVGGQNRRDDNHHSTLLRRVHGDRRLRPAREKLPTADRGVEGTSRVTARPTHRNDLRPPDHAARQEDPGGQARRPFRGYRRQTSRLAASTTTVTAIQPPPMTTPAQRAPAHSATAPMMIAPSGISPLSISAMLMIRPRS